MKSKLIMVILLTFPIGLLAQSTSESRERMVSQIGITRDAIANILAQLQNNIKEDPNIRFSHPDFLDKAQVFNTRVEGALVEYEKELRSCLTEAYFYVQLIKDIESNKNYSESQRQALFEEQVQTTKMALAEISQRYALAVNKLYNLDMPQLDLAKNSECLRKDSLYYGSFYYTDVNLIYSNQVVFSQEKYNLAIPPEASYGSCQEEFARLKRSQAWYYTNFEKVRYPVYNVNSLSSKLESFIFENIIKTQCFTSSCVVLYSNLRSSYLKMIRRELAHDIELITTKTDEKLFKELILSADKSLVGNYELLYNGTSMRSGSTAGMPFQITPEEFQQKLQEEKNRAERQKRENQEAEERRNAEEQQKLELQAREQLLEKLKDLLLMPGQGIFKKWSCFQEVGRIKEQICGMSLSCLSEGEIVQLQKQIKKSELYRQSERLECLKK